MKFFLHGTYRFIILPVFFYCWIWPFSKSSAWISNKTKSEQNFSSPAVIVREMFCWFVVYFGFLFSVLVENPWKKNTPESDPPSVWMMSSITDYGYCLMTSFPYYGFGSSVPQPLQNDLWMNRSYWLWFSVRFLFCFNLIPFFTICS